METDPNADGNSIIQKVGCRMKISTLILVIDQVAYLC